MSTNLRAGQLDKRIATLGKPLPSARKVNTRQYRFPFNALSTNPTLSQYVVIEQAGKAFGLNNASDPGAVVIVHVNVPGNSVYVTPGTPKPIPEGFERLYLERPTQPAVPARGDLFYIFDLSDREDGISYGPLPVSQVLQGAGSYTSPVEAAVLIGPNAGTAPQLVLAAEAARRIVRVRNTSPGVETVYVTLDATSTNQDYNSAGVIEALAPGQQVELPYTGGIYAFASANTAKVRVYSLS